MRSDGSVEASGTVERLDSAVVASIPIPAEHRKAGVHDARVKAVQPLDTRHPPAIVPIVAEWSVKGRWIVGLEDDDELAPSWSALDPFEMPAHRALTIELFVP